jgi:regulator of sirC expression with transglutaminase-like and TPR domain
MTNEPLYIHPAEARRRFEEFARREINEVNLSEGALLVALEESPQLDLEACLKTLDALAERVAARMAIGEPAIFLLGHLHHELFDVEGYTGNTIAYDDVRNSYLNEVIASKRGLPITLSIVFMHVAQRVGLDVHGVGLPGHYIVRVQFPLSEVYVDPYYGGRTLTVREIDAMLAEMSGGEIRLRPHFLRRWTGRETLIRLLANIQNAHARVGDKRKALSAEERIAILSRYAPPNSAEPV